MGQMHPEELAVLPPTVSHFFVPWTSGPDDEPIAWSAELRSGANPNPRAKAPSRRRRKPALQSNGSCGALV